MFTRTTAPAGPEFPPMALSPGGAGQEGTVDGLKEARPRRFAGPYLSCFSMKRLMSSRWAMINLAFFSPN